MLDILAVIVAVLVASPSRSFSILAAIKPDTFSVRRDTTVSAPPEKIFPLIADFHRWGSWSPYEGQGSRDEADLRRRRKRQGRGLCLGRQQECRVRPDGNSGGACAVSKIVIKLDFLKPFEAHNTAEFTMLPQGDGTSLSWLMHGPAPFMSKLMQVFMNMTT